MTCWELFTCGRVPYHGISAVGVLTALKNGERLEKPSNAACSDEMYVHDGVCIDILALVNLALSYTALLLL